MLLQTTLLLLLSFLSGWCQSASAPSEFLRSFLNRPHLLPNAPGGAAKGPTEPLSDDTLSFSVVVDNWSKYSLVYTQYAVTEGALEPRNGNEEFSQQFRSILFVLFKYRVWPIGFF